MLRLTTQARVRVGVDAERDFHRHGTAKLEVAGSIHFAHAARADEAIDLVMPDDTAGHPDRRLLDEPVGVFVRVEQTLHLGSHARLAAARSVQKGRALCRLALQRAVEELFDARPVGVISHEAWRPRDGPRRTRATRGRPASTNPGTART